MNVPMADNDWRLLASLIDRAIDDKVTESRRFNWGDARAGEQDERWLEQDMHALAAMLYLCKRHIKR